MRIWIPEWHAKGNAALAVMEGPSGRRTIGSPAGITSLSPTSRLYGYTHCAEDGGFDLAPYPGTRAWIGRVAGRPGYVPIEA